MIDLRLLRADTARITAAIHRKNPTVDVDSLLELDDARREDLHAFEQLRRTQNEANQHISAEKDPSKKSALVAEMKKVATELKVVQERLDRTTKLLEGKLATVPNPPAEDVPNGGEDDFVVVKTAGTPRNFTFHPRDHAELGANLDLIDTTRGARTSGSRFYYLKNEAVLLEFALAQYVLEKAMARGFTPMLTPQLVRESAMYATGFFPSEAMNIYAVNPSSEANPDGDDLFLIGTSEVPLTMYHADEIIDVASPKKFIGFSTCFRREAGAAGRDTKGIFRVHQFDKLEMYAFCEPSKSIELHEEIRAVEEDIIGGLGLPYRVINIAAGDLGAPAAKKYDIEVWLPSETRYRELTSCSNCTDYQARRANIRYKKESGTEFVHTLNGTACAMTRMLVAIFENYQNEDGSITIPEALKKWLPIEKITPKQTRA